MNSYPATLRDLIARRAESTPDSIAVLATQRSTLSFHALLTQMDEVRRELRRAGIGSLDRVAAVLPCGPEAVAAYLSVAAAAVFVPMNPASTRAEFLNLLQRVRARALLTAAGFAPEARTAAAAAGVPLIEWNIDPAHPAGTFSLGMESSLDGVPRDDDLPGPDDTALVLGTSGSTAQPKLVPLRHAGLCRTAVDTARRLELGASDRFLHLLANFHVQGLVTGVLVPLSVGGSIAAMPGFAPTRFLEALEEFRPTWYSASPSMHLSLLEVVKRARKLPPAPSLQFLRSGSANLSRQNLEALEQGFGVPVIDAYGMTEVPHITSNPRQARRLGSVGPSVSPELAILDPTGCPLPPGDEGEIAVRGPTVMSGYETDGGAPTVVPADGWFRTGDLGRLDADGFLYVTGRIKEIINRGGEKISPYEVEAALLQHPNIVRAVVFAVPDARLGEDLGACIVLRVGSSAEDTALRGFLRERLTPLKIPRHWVRVKELIVGPGGKPVRLGLAQRLGIEGRQ